MPIHTDTTGQKERCHLQSLIAPTYATGIEGRSLVFEIYRGYVLSGVHYPIRGRNYYVIIISDYPYMKISI